MTSEGHAVCFKRCVHVSTCDSCFLPVLKFPQVRTWFPCKSTVCRSTFYWLLPNSRPNNKGPTAIWQAGLAGRSGRLLYLNKPDSVCGSKHTVRHISIFCEMSSYKQGQEVSTYFRGERSYYYMKQQDQNVNFKSWVSCCFFAAWMQQLWKKEGKTGGQTERCEIFPSGTELQNKCDAF